MDNWGGEVGGGWASGQKLGMLQKLMEELWKNRKKNKQTDELVGLVFN